MAESLIGQQFGRLTVIEACGGRSPKGCLLWRCVCSCGNTVVKDTESLSRFRRLSKGSCGCLHRDWTLSGNARRKHGHASRINGESTEYNTWEAMKRRCYNPKDPKYPRYGGRGIKVCVRWLGPNGFTNFLADMGKRPTGLTLDRRNNNKGYSKGNCRWVTQKVQQNNRSNNIARRLKGGDGSS
jgi:hypothetical protein